MSTTMLEHAAQVLDPARPDATDALSLTPNWHANPALVARQRTGFTVRSDRRAGTTPSGGR